MDKVITFGRRPTLGEVRDYYARDDVLEFLLRASRTRQIVLVIPAQGHWKPRWEKDALRAATVAELRAFLLERIGERFAGLRPGDRPPFYPSLHMKLQRWRDGAVGRGSPVGLDGVVEADLPTWREGFRDVFTMIGVLRDEGVPHVSKFSGHRSLHVMVPFSGERLRAEPFGDSAAHRAAVLRVPYSLNEDTGLVSLPLAWDELAAFRPWQAGLHLVEVRGDWLEESTPADRESVREFLAGVKRRDPVPRRAWFDPGATHAALQERASALRSKALDLAGAVRSPAAQAWRRLFGAEPVTAGDLATALESNDPDVRWLTTEAFALRGDDLPRACLPRLVVERDSYVRPAAVELMLRFPERTCEFAVEEMQTEDVAPQAGIVAVLAQAEDLWRRVMRGLHAVPERSGALAARLACVTGVHLRDWPRAWTVIGEAESGHGTEPTWAVRVQALRLMQEMARHWSARAVADCARELGALGTRVLDLLLLAHEVPGRRLRRGFLVAMSELGDERAMDVFIGALGENYRDTARWATRGLLRIGERAVPALVQAAASDQPRLRRYAVRCLGHLGDPRGRDAVMAALEDEEYPVFRQAVLSAKGFASEGDVGLIAEEIRRRRWEVGVEAAELLASLGEAGREAATALAVEDQVPASARWLWKEGDARGRCILIDALSGPAEGRAAAVRLLSEAAGEGELADEELDDQFIDFMRTCPRWQLGMVAEALARMGHRKGLDAIIGMSGHKHQMARKAAAGALGTWDDPRALSALVEMLGDSHRKVRPVVVRALMAHGEKARAALVSAASAHESNRVRKSAAATLRTLDIMRQFDAGAPVSQALLEEIARGPYAWDLAREWVRGRDSEEDVGALLDVLRHEEKVVRHLAAVLLVELGETARAALAEFLAGEPEGTARQAATQALEGLGRERER